MCVGDVITKKKALLRRTPTPSAFCSASEQGIPDSRSLCSSIPKIRCSSSENQFVRKTISTVSLLVIYTTTTTTTTSPFSWLPPAGEESSVSPRWAVDRQREALRCGGVWPVQVLLPLLLPLLLLGSAGFADAAEDAGGGQEEERRRHQHHDTDPHQDAHHLMER